MRAGAGCSGRLEGGACRGGRRGGGAGPSCRLEERLLGWGSPQRSLGTEVAAAVQEALAAAEPERHVLAVTGAAAAAHHALLQVGPEGSVVTAAAR